MTKRIGIAAVFLVGCAVGGGAGQLVVPKATAQQAATLMAANPARLRITSMLRRFGPPMVPALSARSQPALEDPERQIAIEEGELP
jgi:hypothetical protein